MPKKDVQAVLADNLAYFMALDGFAYKSDRGLALAAGLSPNTVTNIKKGRHAAQVDNLEALANKLPKVRGFKCEAWMLVHPDLKRAIRALEMLGTYEERDRDGRKEEESTPRRVQRETQRHGT